MKLTTIQKSLALCLFGISSGVPSQSIAAPVFTFTEYGGFFPGQVSTALYTDEVSGDASVVPAADHLYSTMSWNANEIPQSSLHLNTVKGPSAILAGDWTTISTLSHHNVVIDNAADWGPQNIMGRLVITDSDGAPSVRLDSDNSIAISLTETVNGESCPQGNPVGTICDDFFSFTAEGLSALNFIANDGSSWLASFRIANLINAVQLGNNIFTGESRSSSLDVQVLLSEVSAVPEPTSVGILGLGLLGLGAVRLRQRSFYKRSSNCSFS